MLFFLYEYVSFHFVVNFYDWAYFPVIIDYNLFYWYYWLSYGLNSLKVIWFCLINNCFTRKYANNIYCGKIN